MGRRAVAAVGGVGQELVTTPDFDRVIEAYHLALGQLVKGRPDAATAMFSRQDDVTLANPFGPVTRGYEVLHVAVDDASRLAFVRLLPDDRGSSAARFLVDAAAFFADHGIRIERIMTDRAFTYRLSRHFNGAVQALHVRHKITHPYRPQTNGKAERFIQTLLSEWAYARLYRSNEERHRALPKWLRYYNYSRPHTALKGKSPMAVCKQRL